MDATRRPVEDHACIRDQLSRHRWTSIPRMDESPPKKASLFPEDERAAEARAAVPAHADSTPEVVFDRRDARTASPQPRRGRGIWLITLALLVLAALAWWWWRQQQPAPAPSVPMASAPTAPAPPASAPIEITVPPAPATATIQNPIEDAAKLPTLPSLEASDPTVRKALVNWLGEKAVDGVLRSDEFVRRVVVTVDNLGREHAAPRLWPANPAPGRFIVQRKGNVETPAPENAARYQAFAALVASIDAGRAATLYRQHYPLFQQAYRELGYPTGYFNDRLIQVIDRLLATPEPAQPPAVRKVEIKGEMAGDMPTSNFYEFADPALDKLTAGQKLLLRMGNDHARKIKVQLRAFRAAIVKS